MDAPNPFAKSGPALAEIKVDHYNLNQALSKDDATNKPEKQPASQVAKPDESKPHDPSSTILVQNVKANQEIEKTNSKPLVVSLSKSMVIKKILSDGGMDSQQAGHSLNKILEVIQGK